MYLVVGKTFDVRLEEPTDFKKFHIEVAHPASAAEKVGAALKGIASLDDTGHAWVSAARLRAWPGVDAAFRDGLANMIEKAKPYGWIDEAKDAIKAHVKWQG
jgi:hypothetical protein